MARKYANYRRTIAEAISQTDLSFRGDIPALAEHRDYYTHRDILENITGRRASIGFSVGEVEEASQIQTKMLTRQFLENISKGSEELREERKLAEQQRYLKNRYRKELYNYGLKSTDERLDLRTSYGLVKGRSNIVFDVETLTSGTPYHMYFSKFRDSWNFRKSQELELVTPLELIFGDEVKHLQATLTREGTQLGRLTPQSMESRFKQAFYNIRHGQMNMSIDKVDQDWEIVRALYQNQIGSSQITRRGATTAQWIRQLQGLGLTSKRVNLVGANVQFDVNRLSSVLGDAVRFLPNEFSIEKQLAREMISAIREGTSTDVLPLLRTTTGARLVGRATPSVEALLGKSYDPLQAHMPKYDVWATIKGMRRFVRASRGTDYIGDVSNIRDAPIEALIRAQSTAGARTDVVARRGFSTAINKALSSSGAARLTGGVLGGLRISEVSYTGGTRYGLSVEQAGRVSAHTPVSPTATAFAKKVKKVFENENFLDERKRVLETLKGIDPEFLFSEQGMTRMLKTFGRSKGASLDEIISKATRGVLTPQERYSRIVRDSDFLSAFKWKDKQIVSAPDEFLNIKDPLKRAVILQEKLIQDLYGRFNKSFIHIPTQASDMEATRILQEIEGARKPLEAVRGSLQRQVLAEIKAANTSLNATQSRRLAALMSGNIYSRYLFELFGSDQAIGGIASVITSQTGVHRLASGVNALRGRLSAHGYFDTYGDVNRTINDMQLSEKDTAALRKVAETARFGRLSNDFNVPGKFGRSGIFSEMMIRAVEEASPLSPTVNVPDSILFSQTETMNYIGEQLMNRVPEAMRAQVSAARFSSRGIYSVANAMRSLGPEDLSNLMSSFDDTLSRNLANTLVSGERVSALGENVSMVDDIWVSRFLGKVQDATNQTFNFEKVSQQLALDKTLSLDVQLLSEEMQDWGAAKSFDKVSDIALPNKSLAYDAEKVNLGYQRLVEYTEHPSSSKYKSFNRALNSVLDEAGLPKVGRKELKLAMIDFLHTPGGAYSFKTGVGRMLKSSDIISEQNRVLLDLGQEVHQNVTPKRAKQTEQAIATALRHIFKLSPRGEGPVEIGTFAREGKYALASRDLVFNLHPMSKIQENLQNVNRGYAQLQDLRRMSRVTMENLDIDAERQRALQTVIETLGMDKHDATRLAQTAGRLQAFGADLAEGLSVVTGQAGITSETWENVPGAWFGGKGQVNATALNIPGMGYGSEAGEAFPSGRIVISPEYPDVRVAVGETIGKRNKAFVPASKVFAPEWAAGWDLSLARNIAEHPEQARYAIEGGRQGFVARSLAWVRGSMGNIREKVRKETASFAPAYADVLEEVIAGTQAPPTPSTGEIYREAAEATTRGLTKKFRDIAQSKLPSSWKVLAAGVAGAAAITMLRRERPLLPEENATYDGAAMGYPMGFNPVGSQTTYMAPPPTQGVRASISGVLPHDFNMSGLQSMFGGLGLTNVNINDNSRGISSRDIDRMMRNNL